jgi:ATP-dependent DNA helicase DinG
MGLEHQVIQVLEPGGPLSKALVQYRFRHGQMEMARAVSQTMEVGGALVVEAGTGIGKTFAYLIPALLLGDRVLISTATKALQDQLFRRDIAQLQRMLGIAVRLAMLKGRSSYLCIHRLNTARIEPTISEPDLQDLARVETWATSTSTGDLAEVDGLEETSDLWPAITSTRENCPGSRCSDFAKCHVFEARRQAMAADVVVINHHLFFADLNVRESGVAELLPTVRSVVFDEAHQLNEIGVQFLGQQWTTGQLQSLADELVKVTRERARGYADWEALASELTRAAQGLIEHFEDRRLTGRIGWDDDESRGEPARQYRLMACTSALAQLLESLNIVSAVAPDLELLHSRCRELHDRVYGFGQARKDGFVRWADVGAQVRMVESPVDISSAMQARVIGALRAPENQKSWIFTSATLGHDAALSWFVHGTGLQNARVLQIPSPFDYAAQASLYIPQNFPGPTDAGHSEAVAGLVGGAVTVLGGRTLVLTTTLRALRKISTCLRIDLRNNPNLELLVQGDMPKRELLERFASGGGDARGGFVLVASASFWEGIDIPGDALQLLVIDKLPFSPPDDPIQRARSSSLESQGKSAFKNLHLPAAAIALKQGAGRLIRCESDQGILVVCDVRLTRMGYGKSLMAGFPPMTKLDSQEAFDRQLALLTRLSTTDRYSSGRL